MHILRPIIFFVALGAMIVTALVLLHNYWVSIPLTVAALTLTISALPNAKGESWI